MKHQITNDDRRIILDKLYFFNKKKSGTFTKGLWGTLTFKNVEELLKDKRKDYNFGYHKLLNAYGLDEKGNLYKRLDKIWDKQKTIFEYAKEYIEKQTGRKITRNSRLYRYIVLRNPSLVITLSTTYVIAYQFAVKKFWGNYIEDCTLHAKKHSLKYVKK